MTWRYDVSYQYSEVDMANLNGNYFIARLNQALKAELDADGNIVAPRAPMLAACLTTSGLRAV